MQKKTGNIRKKGGSGFEIPDIELDFNARFCYPPTILHSFNSSCKDGNSLHTYPINIRNTYIYRYLLNEFSENHNYILI